MFQKKLNQTCQFKFADEGKGQLAGYASVFNSNDAVNDTIIKGAFVDSLDKGIPMFINHNHNEMPVGTFKGEEDDTGLFVEGSINLKHKDGTTVYSAIKRGDVSGMSIGFQMGKDGYTNKEDGGRIINKVDLQEVSIVTYPCEDMARISAVKQAVWDAVETKRDLEHLLRDEFGVSKSMACTFLSHTQRVMSGELTDALDEIKSLKQVIASYEKRSLLETIKKLGK